MVGGVRISAIANRLAARKNWVVVNLSPEREMLTPLAAELSNRPEFFELFRDARINLSFLGLGIEIDGVPPITDTVVAIRRMLARITKTGKRVLITIDEVSPNIHIIEFVSQFQIFMRENLNVFLLMTGLYENIEDLQNVKTLTFLYRAPKIELKPLNLSLIAKKYKESFNLNDEESMSMAKATMGYSFAFQVLGYLCWKHQDRWENLLPEYDAYLEDYVYEKIWSELSKVDKDVLFAMRNANISKVEDIREEMGVSSNYFNSYRRRLLKKGVLFSPDHGWLSFSLPRFREFVQRMMLFD